MQEYSEPLYTEQPASMSYQYIYDENGIAHLVPAGGQTSYLSNPQNVA